MIKNILSIPHTCKGSPPKKNREIKKLFEVIMVIINNNYFENK